MKSIKFKYILIGFIALSFLLVNSSFIYSQIFPWSTEQRITSGHIDKNPSFGTKQEYFAVLFSWEFLAFERHVDSSSNICVLKINTEGPDGSVTYITNENNKNTNPSISYNSTFNFFDAQITSSLILWESERNGRRDIYACYYSAQSGWQNPFPVDTSEFDKSLPRSVNIDTVNYAIVYERDNDIIFRVLNAQTHSISYDTNLTVTDTAKCGNPFITNKNGYYVSYEKAKSNNDNSIEYRRTFSLPGWTSADTISYRGNNINNGFVEYSNNPLNIFSSNRLGNFNIYGTDINAFQGQSAVVIDTGSQNYDYESFYYPIITDEGFFNHANAYINKSDSVRIYFSGYFSLQDSVTVSDSSSFVSLTMNRALKTGSYDALIWVIYNKDSLGYSNLCGKSVRLIITNINEISAGIPVTFHLYQNYPNPFNPVTKIKFDIPQINGNASPDVKLIVYDELGREVESLIDKQLSPGTFEVSWNAGKYPSGIYFYRMSISGGSDNYSVTKKLMLLK